MTIHTFASDIADRIPEMARDSKLNNQKLVENLLREFLEKKDGALRISGEPARIFIMNSHSMLKQKFANSPLWSLVGQLTGHGSGYSIEICKSANLDPMQMCGRAELVNLK